MSAFFAIEIDVFPVDENGKLALDYVLKYMCKFLILRSHYQKVEGNTNGHNCYQWEYLPAFLFRSYLSLSTRIGSLVG